MEFKTYMDNLFNAEGRPNVQNDATQKKDERADLSPSPSNLPSQPVLRKRSAYKWTKVNSWEEVLKKL